MVVAFLTNDLVFPSRVRPVVERLGARLEVAGSVDGLAEKIGAAPAVVIFDLNMLGVDPGGVVSQLKSLEVPPRAIIAFGPHVHEARLAAAKAAGCDAVMSRGQFDAQMEAVLRKGVESCG